VVRDGAVFAILDPPANQSATGIVAYVQTTAALLNLPGYAAIYWPRVKALNPAKSLFGPADKIEVPPSGITAGVRAASGRQRSANSRQRSTLLSAPRKEQIVDR
jgi:hypothetical protein